MDKKWITLDKSHVAEERFFGPKRAFSRLRIRKTKEVKDSLKEWQMFEKNCTVPKHQMFGGRTRWPVLVIL